VDYAFSPRIRVNATYQYVRGTGVFRGLNLNAPIDGVRPSGPLGNVIQVAGDASLRQHVLVIGGNTNPPSEQGRAAPLWNFRRFNFFGNCILNWSENNSDGPFSVPATGDLDLEWGVPGAGSQGPGVPGFGTGGPGYAKYRFFGGFLTQAYRDVALQVNINGHLGTNYTEQTGLDDNGDLIFNDALLRQNTLLARPR
jgi:hypothetical protein